MSVIAKLSMNDEPRILGDAKLYELGCVYDTDLAHKDNENYRFTQASPSGSARIWTKELPGRNGDQFYFIFTRGEAPANCDGAVLANRIRVAAVTEYGGTSRQIELASHYEASTDLPEELQVSSFNMRMLVDNPAASIQFEAGKTDYWLRAYPASKMTMDQALALAL